MKKLLLISAISGFFVSFSQSGNRYWSPAIESEIRLTGKRQIVPQKYLTFKMNATELKSKLFSAPNEKNVKINESTCIISLPVPNGNMQQFRVVESPIMEQGLADQFPDMKTFSVKGIDDPYANGKLDWTETGFHGNIRSVNGDFFIDPYCVSNTTDYITYYTSDFVKDPSQIIPETGVLNDAEKPGTKKKESGGAQKTSSQSVPSVGDYLRTYRLAVSCTGEYAKAATGLSAPTVSQTLSKIVTTVNRINSVYETEVAIRLILVATETLVVFTDPATDPYSGNNNSFTLIGESQSVISATIGAGNYDIGHTFSTGAGGLAQLGCVCNNSMKAQGVTGQSVPVGDPFDIDYVAHEMGHQFSGNHCFNATSSSCGGGNRNGATAVEPGSGITVMAYAGICGSTNNLANNSIAYFHGTSFDEISDFSTIGTGSFCAATSTTGNQAPLVLAPATYTVPKSTAFFLTGSATDGDGDVLTYSWEEVDPGVAGNWNSGNKPYFRTYAPTTVPTRYFPAAGVVLTGNYTGTKGEYVPPSAQTLQFRLTARDNKMAGGGVSYATTTVVVDNSGPFAVSYPNAAGLTWFVNGTETITWNVNGTDAAPVACDSVRILISYNAGNTYTVLVGSTPNDGAETISVPSVTAPVSTCRIKVESRGNVFYDVSNNNFTISDVVGIRKISGNNPVSLSVWPNPFSNNIHFTASGLNANETSLVKITDVMGKIIFQIEYKNKTTLLESIDLSDISTGIYFVNLSNGSKRAVYKIVKE